jgi:hypothetical protein
MPWFAWKTLNSDLHNEAAAAALGYTMRHLEGSEFNPKTGSGIIGCFDSILNICGASIWSDTSKSKSERVFRLDTEQYTYMIRLLPNVDFSLNDDNYFIYCYVRDAFNAHLLKARKGITFYKAEGEPMFTVADGDEVAITGAKGKMIAFPCRYVSNSECLIGGDLYTSTIWDVDENQIIPMYNTLPRKSFYCEPATGNLVLVVKGAQGYSVYPRNTDNVFENKRIADKLNADTGVSKAQAEAMFHGCTVSWHDAEANPDNYDDNGHFVERGVAVWTVPV